MSNFISKIDYHIAKAFHTLYAWGGEFANGFMKGVSFIAEAGILFLLIGLGLVLFKCTRKVGATILLAVAIGFLVANLILKPLIERSRPFENVSSDFYKWWLDAGANHESGHSFPSGHTTATTAFALAIYLTTNKKYSGWILLLPFAMACSRIYLMVHYFTDCLGGLVVGSASAMLAYLIIKLTYSSKAKIFIWLREFDVFKPKKSLSTIKITPNPTETNEQANVKVEEFVYSTQAEEKLQASTANPIESEISPETVKKTDNTNNNK